MNTVILIDKILTFYHKKKKNRVFVIFMFERISEDFFSENAQEIIQNLKFQALK